MQSNNKLPSLENINLSGKRVLVRLDLNVPIDDGEIVDETRITETLKTLVYLIEKAEKVIILSHLGRPTEGCYEERYSLKPVASRLSQLLNKSIPLARSFDELDIVLNNFDVVMFENVRFQVGETKNSSELSSLYAKRVDLFVMDAFGASHREHASTCGVINFVDQACAGYLMEKEITALEKVICEPLSPIIAIVGGSKVSTKLEVLSNLMQHVDYLILGGGIANTLLLAKGINMQASLVEASMLSFALDLLEGKYGSAEILLPDDAVCANSFDDLINISEVPIGEIPENSMMLDIGTLTTKVYREVLIKAKTIIWNGPLGVFEKEPFSYGTKAIAETIVASDAYALAGGGDTVAAINQFGLAQGISYISTGGGASLEFLGGKVLPAIEALRKNLEVVTK
jgi:phosphoglycerate kinase